MSETTIIVGGGVSGLATAWFLARRGVKSTIVEKSKRLGGLIKTDLYEGCELEAGPDSFLAAKTAVADLSTELGTRDWIIGSNDRERQIFLVHAGRLLPMPEGMVMMVPAELRPALRSDLFSPETKQRFLLERRFLPRQRAEDITVGQLVEEHFGPEMVDVLAEPLLSGVYGGDSAKLSAQSVLPRFLAYEREYGSLIKGVRQERANRKRDVSLFQSFRGGMQTLTDALAAAIAPVTTLVQGEALEVQKSTARWQVRLADAVMSADRVVLACPAHVNCGLVEKVSVDLATELGNIPYSSAVLVMLLYRRDTVDHPLNGFGFLVPRSERRMVAAATWVNTKWPSRIRPDFVALRAFIVGEDADAMISADQQQAVEVARQEFERLMGIAAAPVFSTVHFLPSAMPQYIVGHQDRVAKIRASADALSGLHLVGNAYDGVGIPDCIRLARRAADEAV